VWWSTLGILISYSFDGGSFTDYIQAAFSNVGLGQAPSQLSEELFRQPLVQALLSEGDEDVAMGEEDEGVASRPIPDKEDMWMDPAEAIAILNGTSKKYESMKDLFSKVDWG
jgi:hypothetical protein